MDDPDSLTDAVQRVLEEGRLELARRRLLELPRRQELARQRLVAGIEDFLRRMNVSDPTPNPGTHELSMRDSEGTRHRERGWSVTWTAHIFPEHFGLTPDGRLQNLDKDLSIWERSGRFFLTPDGRLQHPGKEWVSYREADFFGGADDYDPTPEADAALDALAALIRRHLGP